MRVALGSVREVLIVLVYLWSCIKQISFEGGGGFRQRRRRGEDLFHPLK